MKTLKTFLVCSIALLLCSCVEKEPVFLTAYTFHNQSPYNIAILIDCKVGDSQTSMIPKGESATIFSRAIGDYINVPFCPWYVNPLSYSVTISNGKVEIHNSYSGENGPVGLFDNSLYTYMGTDKKKHTKYYEYTFTDDFFKEAAVEPEE